MAEVIEVDENSTKHPKKTTFYASFLTGIVASAAFIKDATLRNVITIAAPLTTHFLTICGKSILHNIECNRGIRIYQELIDDLEQELTQAGRAGRKKEIEGQLKKLRADLQKAKKDTIKMVVY